MLRFKILGLAVVLVTVILSCQPEWVKKAPKYDYSGMDKYTIEAHKEVEEFLYKAVTGQYTFRFPKTVRIDSLLLDREAEYMEIHLNKSASFIPLREDNLRAIYAALREEMDDYEDWHITIWSLGVPLRELIPNYFRGDPSRYDKSRLPVKRERPLPLVRRLDQPEFSSGLYGNNIALWHSHGWYYNVNRKRWEWQRPRLFQTVEDLLPLSFVVPYLVPMLENARANVFLPRERDGQTHEVVVDNDSFPQIYGRYKEQWIGEDVFNTKPAGPGFAVGQPPYGRGDNPFLQGTFRAMRSDTLSGAAIEWIPNIPEEGRYAVYVSFYADSNNVDDAHYTVYHQGGKSRFLVNQQIGGSTWVYLGTFLFKKGTHLDSGRVELTNQSAKSGLQITADAVRFGGGMGNIQRDGYTSGRPRYHEGSKYYLQYAGFPDSLIFELDDEEDDYKDDYRGRPEWVNYLVGAPFGPNKNRQAKGLGIPIDVSLAFHTDAGIAHTDTSIGTLVIYSIEDAETLRVFPDGVSRLANRDFADILQTQIVDDIRAAYDPEWTRRALREDQYSEAFRPNVPAALLELLSHQNFQDMKFAQDPGFRFLVARAIYKSMLRFIAHRYDRSYTVQPLPVTHFSAVFDTSGDIRLSWQAQEDPLEPGAEPQAYKVYIQQNDNDFDSGRLVKDNTFVFRDWQPEVMYSFKVTALNDGGESFPSEVLSVCKKADDAPVVCIVNAFDRVSAPQIVETEGWHGFMNMLDNGVADGYDVSFVGEQYAFSDSLLYKSNDFPGHGASFADYETTIIPGNTHNFPRIHGWAIKEAGYSFVSCSDEAVEDRLIDLKDYHFVDLILGEEKATPSLKKIPGREAVRFRAFSKTMQHRLTQYLSEGGNLFLSGAYIATDLTQGTFSDEEDRMFAENVLKVKWDANYGSRKGYVFSVQDSFLARNDIFRFNTGYDPNIYTVEAPDAINPANGAEMLLRYRENRYGAGIGYRGSYGLVLLGFPFETVLKEADRVKLMKAVLNYLKN